MADTETTPAPKAKAASAGSSNDESVEPADAGVSTPGSHDLAIAAANPQSRPQVIPQGGEAVPAEGDRLRELAEQMNEDSNVVSLAAALNATDPGLKYDETGLLVNGDGKRIALSADGLDPDVGWTVQHAGAHLDEKDRVNYPGGYAGVPDQTFHPDELPDPLSAIRAGLLPQNMSVLNIDPLKFEGKKSLEP